MQTRRIFLMAAWAGAALSSSLTPKAEAALFANQFVQFEIPAQWVCTLEGAEWVCQSREEGKKRDAIVVLAAKLKGDQDTIPAYEQYLSRPKTYTSVDGKPVRSEVKWTKQSDVNGQPWIDSLHLESEMPGFYTRYLATIKSDIGVLVTYSINKDKYQSYLADFDKMVASMQVFRRPGNLNQAQPSVAPQDTANTSATPQTVGTESVFGVVGDRTRNALEDTTTDASTSGVSKLAIILDEFLYLFIVLAVAVIGILVLKKIRSGGNGPTGGGAS